MKLEPFDWESDARLLRFRAPFGERNKNMLMSKIFVKLQRIEVSSIINQ